MDLRCLKQMIDLTHEIRESTPAYPGDPKVSRERVYTVDRDGFAVDAWRIGTHLGTHVDAAAHVFEGNNGVKLSEYPLSRFEGVARVAEIKEGESEITIEAVRKVCPSDRQVDWIIVRSGWEKYWDRPETYFAGRYPILTSSAVEFLANVKIKGIALDMPSPDPYGQDAYIHRKLLAHGLLIVENLANVELLPMDEDLWLSVWPLKLASGDAAPVRAIARF